MFAGTTSTPELLAAPPSPSVSLRLLAAADGLSLTLQGDQAGETRQSSHTPVACRMTSMLEHGASVRGVAPCGTMHMLQDPARITPNCTVQ